jgi:hypothetical protein
MTGRTDSTDLPVGYRLSIRRLFLLPLGLSAFVVLAGLVAVSWRRVEGIRPIQSHLAHIARIQDLGLTLEQTLFQGLRGTRIESADLARLRGELTTLATLDGHLHPATRERLDLAAQRLSMPGTAPLKTLIATLTELRAVLDGVGACSFGGQGAFIPVRSREPVPARHSAVHRRPGPLPMVVVSGGHCGLIVNSEHPQLAQFHRFISTNGSDRRENTKPFQGAVYLA